ncbi:hypothetical protein HanRHA438_Chr12g0539841 [Helianthus annuus]|nr:hypothetical protein HanRHA438_Chr12g0539841 [Helianthus annuus]
MISVQIIEYRGVISRIFKCFGNGVDGYCDRVSSFRMTEICFLDSFDYCQKGLGSPAFYKLEAELDEDHPRVKKIIQEFDRVVPNCVF